MKEETNEVELSRSKAGKGVSEQPRCSYNYLKELMIKR